MKFQRALEGVTETRIFPSIDAPPGREQLAARRQRRMQWLFSILGLVGVGMDSIGWLREIGL